MVLDFGKSPPLAHPLLPPPYLSANYEPSLREPWRALINESREFWSWDVQTMDEQLLSIFVPETAFFAVHGGKPVAASAAGRMAQFAPYALLLWPVVLPSHRGHGLGAAVIARTVTACRERGFPGVLLHTQPSRVPAIKTYLRLGFQPRPYGVRTRLVWPRVLASINSSPW
jgi:GNAT superfamily N-acetyltransferase